MNKPQLSSNPIKTFKARYSPEAHIPTGAPSTGDMIQYHRHHHHHRQRTENSTPPQKKTPTSGFEASQTSELLEYRVLDTPHTSSNNSIGSSRSNHGLNAAPKQRSRPDQRRTPKVPATSYNPRYVLQVPGTKHTAYSSSGTRLQYQHTGHSSTKQDKIKT